MGMTKFDEIMGVIWVLGIAFIVLMFVGYMFNITHGYDLTEECNKYREEYNINTQTVGNFWKWDASFDCVVLMDDGTKVSLHDFNIAAVKIPLEAN